MIIGIDLSMRSTAVVAINDTDIKFKLITSTAKQYNDEELLIYNAKELCNFISNFEVDYINFEALSFNSTSSSKDILWGNYWHTRVELRKQFKNVKINFCEVLSWRNKVVPIETRRSVTEANKRFKALKTIIGYDKLPRNEKIIFNKQYEKFINEDCCIKFQTYNLLPDEIKSTFSLYNKDNGLYDLTDAYFISKYKPT